MFYAKTFTYYYRHNKIHFHTRICWNSGSKLYQRRYVHIHAHSCTIRAWCDVKAKMGVLEKTLFKCYLSTLRPTAGQCGCDDRQWMIIAVGLNLDKYMSLKL